MPYIVPALTVLASFAGAWLAAHFALRRFYQERIWERKAAAYTTVFEALYEISRWFGEHHNALENRQELDSDYQEEMSLSYQEAMRTLGRRVSGEAWLLPDEFTAILDEMQKDLQLNVYDWHRHIETGVIATTKARAHLLPIGRRELKM